MSKWALIIGSQTGGLQGVDHDARRMASALHGRGFHVDLRIAADATRAGMLDGYRALIEHARATGDSAAAVVYYAGHGASVDAAERDPAGGVVRMQAILPFDVDAWTDDDFRGVSTWELSLLQAELTAITRNATVILDCCHAGELSRSIGPPSSVRARPVRPRRLARHLDDLRARGAPLDRLHPAGNPHAVRLVAAGQYEHARERATRAGVWSGVMTDAFLGVLDQIGDAEVPWSAIGRAVRERVQAEYPDQRPDVEGPVHRALFSLRELPDARAVAVFQHDGATRLRAGRLAGVVAGDVYGIMPALAPAYRGAHALGTARVTELTALEAQVAVELRPPCPRLPPDAIAFPQQVALPRLPVAVEIDDGWGPSLEAAIAASPRLRLVETAELPLVTIRRAGPGLVVEDGIGPLSEPTPSIGPDAIAKVVAIAGVRAVGQSVLLLHGDPSAAGRAEVEWGLVIDGKPVAQPPHGRELRVGDAIYVAVDNLTQARIFAHIFNVGPLGEVALLNSRTPGGLPIEPGARRVLGSDAGVLRGQRVSWPTGMPATSPRRDDLVVIATRTSIDLRVLETTAEAARGAVTRGSLSLVRLLSQLHVGGTRDSLPPEVDDCDAQILHRSFILRPPAEPRSPQGGEELRR